MEKVPYVVGDVHGCYDEMRRLEDRVLQNAADKGWQPLFVCVGDLLDRGPDSRAVVEHYRKGAEAGTHAVVMGNHESEFIRQVYAFRPELFLEHGITFPLYMASIDTDFLTGQRGAKLFTSVADFRHAMRTLWLDQGGRETLASYGALPKKPATWDIDPSHLAFLAGLPLFWESPELVVSHALLGPGDLQCLRKGGEDYGRVAFTALWNRKMPPIRPDFQRLHVSGHTPLEGVHISEELGIIQLDTGCVYGRRLTAYCHASQSFLSEDSLTTWQR